MHIAKPASQRVTIPRNMVTWLLIAVLFFLRIVLAGLAPTLMKNPPEWANTVYEVGTFFTVVVLIWWERQNLAEFFIDRLALIILILGKPCELLLYQLQLPYAFTQSEIYWLYLPIAFGLLTISVFVYPKLNNLEAKNWLWFLTGTAAGIVSGILVGYLLRHQSPDGTVPLTPSLMFFLPIRQLVSAGVAEEPFFRGFLWGALRRLGWKDLWILIFQTILFMIGHLYYFGNLPISFWIVVPVGGIVTGLLAWRSRSIATSMIGHGFFNAVGLMVAFCQF